MSFKNPREIQTENIIPECCQFIDVREPSEFHAERISGAQLMPLSKLKTLSKELDKTKPLLLVCRSGNRARQAAESLSDQGFLDVRILKGGIEGWKTQGGKVEVNPSRVWSMERQVRFTAGALVFLGIVGAWLIHPFLLGMSGFVALGLMYSAVSNTCTMALVLGRLPWNQSPSSCHITRS